MASTTNYSWSTPDDTALVKDGAAAIRSLGSAIDSTVFTNAGAAIAKTIVDAKGDIIAATAADTVARLGVGANNTVLTADSTAATGLKWAAPAGGGKVLQVIQSVYSTQTSTTSSTYTDTGLTATITPSSSSSRIAIFINGVVESASSGGSLRIVRDSTSVYAWGGYIAHPTGTLSVGESMSYVDSPATTSATVYKLQFNTFGGTFRWAAGTLPSSIILMEIGA